ncbi:MAG: hypothetical protein HZA51_08670 [Planctomycetes bacterium]|nr:hypothetical protein [Planctomycetota bacterium]
MIHTNKVLVYVVAFALSSSPITHAGIIVDQPPSQYYGFASDTAFYNEFGLLRWQKVADDFTLETDTPVRQLTWWAFYGGVAGSSLDPPTGDETILVRFYAARPADGLPGVLMRELTVVNVQRVATGRRVGVMGSPEEYRFDIPLSKPFVAVGGSRYWIEIFQMGLDDSLFRWQASLSVTNGCAFINMNVGDWTPVPPNLAMQLSDIPEPDARSLVVFLSAVVLLQQRFGRRTQ